MIKLHCEICDRVITTQSDYKKIRDWIQSKGMQCSPCEKMQVQLLGFVEKKKAYYMKQIDLLVKQSHVDIKEEIEKIVKGDKDGKRIDE